MLDLFFRRNRLDSIELKTHRATYLLVTCLAIAGMLVAGLVAGIMILTSEKPPTSSISTVSPTVVTTVSASSTASSIETALTAGFPPHLLELRGDILVNLDSGQTIEVIRFHDIDLVSSYPHLTVKAGFRIARAELASAGGDILGLVVAIHAPSGQGFVVERLNGTQGGYLFAPIDDPDEAIEYAQFMMHETPSSVYGRDYREIGSSEQFRQTLSTMEERARNFNLDLKFLASPPANFTIVIQKDMKYEVSRLYHQFLERDRITWAIVLVWVDGQIILVSEQTYVMGAPGARP